MIRVSDAPGNVIETREHAGEFKVCEARETKSRHAGDVTADCLSF